ncbi:hypothetical protein [Bdellovibrio bacteriovorus]|uniref:hypothetical protein n=1 Tax=Bdellovibrio bacteriovorus TaxID=959 RepID=UPI0035A5AD91
MGKYLLTLSLCVFMGSFSATAVASASTGAASQFFVTGVVEHVEAIENEAMVKVSGVQKLLIIKNLMSFPEAKLQVLVESQESRVPLKLKVNGSNHIIDVML